MTMYPGQLVCMEPGDHAALAAAGYEPGAHAFKVQYEDCSAEVLDLVTMAKIGCPCTELCTLQQECGRAAPAKHHRRRWVLAKHDTEANRQLLLGVGAQAPKGGAPRKRKPKKKPPTAAAPAPAQGMGDSSSGDDTTIAEHLRRNVASTTRKNPKRMKPNSQCRGLLAPPTLGLRMLAAPSAARFSPVGYRTRSTGCYAAGCSPSWLCVWLMVAPPMSMLFSLAPSTFFLTTKKTSAQKFPPKKKPEKQKEIVAR